jgi:hypothetical protein
MSSGSIDEHWVGFEVLTAVVVKFSIFWDITPCSPLKVDRRFGGTYRLHLQGRRISRARNQRESRRQAERCVFFDPEDGDDMFHRNVGRPLTDYKALIFKDFSLCHLVQTFSGVPPSFLPTAYRALFPSG